MVTLVKALEELPPERLERAKDALAAIRAHGSTIARLVLRNIDDEHRLPIEVWRKVLDLVLTVETALDHRQTASRVFSAIQNGFRACLIASPGARHVPSLQPVGPKIEGLSPEAFGRLVSESTLTSLWFASDKARPHSDRPRINPTYLRCLIDKLSSMSSLLCYQKLLRDMPLGQYILWSTFDAETFGPDPFHSMPREAGRLAAALGLDPKILFGELPADMTAGAAPSASCILLSYRLPDGIDPCVPTVVEAYAGTPNYFFQVCRYPIDVAHRVFPKTFARPELDDHPGLPEVVNGVVFADHLVRPLEFARY